MKSHLNRRALLKGLGTVSIGLPLLEEMITANALGDAPAKVPVRAFNVFFGLGIPAPLQSEGFDDVLEPLKPLSKKLLIMRNVDHVRCDVRGINAHFDGATASFTAQPAGGEAKAGGPSIDQMVRHAHHPQGLPAGMVPTLVAGTFFRRSRVGRYHHSYTLDGTVAARMQEKPRDLFDRVFGTLANANEMRDWRIYADLTQILINKARPLYADEDFGEQLRLSPVVELHMSSSESVLTEPSSDSILTVAASPITVPDAHPHLISALLQQCAQPPGSDHGFV